MMQILENIVKSTDQATSFNQSLVCFYLHICDLIQLLKMKPWRKKKKGFIKKNNKKKQTADGKQKKMV